jgi:hypothetical protein
MRLYVDGTQIGALPNQTAAQTYWGSWRIGGDQLNSWPLRPTSNYFACSIDEFAVYPCSAYGHASFAALQPAEVITGCLPGPVTAHGA